MKIESIKQLKSVIQLCRRNGVTAIEIDGIKLNLLELRQKPRINAYDADPLSQAKIPTYTPIQAQESQDEAITTSNERIDTPDELTDEQLLNWSARSEPQ